MNGVLATDPESAKQSPSAENNGSHTADSSHDHDGAVSQLLRMPSHSSLISSEQLSSYKNQVGGHGEFVKLGGSRLVLKPFVGSEFSFYHQIQAPRFRELLPFTARCYGAVDVDESSCSNDSMTSKPCFKYVMLEDLAHGFQKPCVLDLKMGLKQRSLKNISTAKLLRTSMKSMGTTSHLLGFRLCGVSFYNEIGDRVFKDKYEGRRMDVPAAYIVISEFFSTVRNPGKRIVLIQEFLRRLIRLKKVLLNLPGVRFWSGSLLLVFDAERPELATLKMIDFAQTGLLTTSLSSYDDSPESPGIPIQGRDNPDFEYIYGIENLVEFLNAILQSSIEPPKRTSIPPSPADQDLELVTLVASGRPDRTDTLLPSLLDNGPQ